jgi:hypothetical protein
LEADMGLVQGPLPESFRRMKLKEEQQESQGMRHLSLNLLITVGERTNAGQAHQNSQNRQPVR